jgi:spore germination protein KC
LTRGVLWLRNEVKQANVTVTPKGEKGKITSTLIRAHTELIPKYEKGKWKMIVKATAEDDIILNGTKLNLMNPKYTKMIEKELAKETDKLIRAALKKVQKEMKADIFGFAEVFHRKYPREWNRVKDRWEEIFPDVEVVVKTKAYVRRPGIGTTPQGLPEQEVKQ